MQNNKNETLIILFDAERQTYFIDSFTITFAQYYITLVLYILKSTMSHSLRRLRQKRTSVITYY